MLPKGHLAPVMMYVSAGVLADSLSTGLIHTAMKMDKDS